MQHSTTLALGQGHGRDTTAHYLCTASKQVAGRGASMTMQVSQPRSTHMHFNSLSMTYGAPGREGMHASLCIKLGLGG